MAAVALHRRHDFNRVWFLANSGTIPQFCLVESVVTTALAYSNALAAQKHTVRVWSLWLWLHFGGLWLNGTNFGRSGLTHPYGGR